MSLAYLAFAYQPLLDSRNDPPPPSYSKSTRSKPKNPPSYSTHIHVPSKRTKAKSSRVVHHHKNPAAYEKFPIFENPCPFCFLKHCRKVLKIWIRSQRKPYSAVTVQVDRLTSEQYEENDLGGLVDLIEVVRIQDSGPTEAARALRKKLKYGNVHRQIRALLILDGLIQNAGSRFQRSFADEPLLERLRMMAKDDMVDAEVRQKCNVLFRQWATAYKNTPGLEGIAVLYKQLPHTRRPQPHQSRVVRENEAEVERENAVSPPPSPATARRNPPPQFPLSSSSSGTPIAIGSAPTPSLSLFRRDKKNKNKPFNLEKEKPQLLETIASATVVSTGLMNGLQLINREVQRVSENPEVMKRFENCKKIRRQILRYIQLVESEQYIGSLLSANDELVKALMAFEIMDKSIDDDSDSETEERPAAYLPTSPERGMAGLSFQDAPPARPARPQSIPMPPSGTGKERFEPSSEEEEDEDDPFGDTHAVKTPYHEKNESTWRDV
ncbi:hypothetical protein P154DRAFT_526405 [Amniculicola lignicola CBS 123094]|uniref:VHS domain-containing protein n=1 Tax=Amniculicola lignicola CBS 123094 TaxID=1392246 RepID=A0A6A5W364_9PLEO|nr:hypothetical protein P154DRAFT_526405 [Amniculicola lignicola CBS 123094]